MVKLYENMYVWMLGNCASSLNPRIKLKKKYDEILNQTS